MTEKYNMRSFWRACSDLDYETIKAALEEQKINPNQRKPDEYYGDGETPLGLVTFHAYESPKMAKKCAEELLNHGADVTFLQEGRGYGSASAIDLIDIGEVPDKAGYREYFKFLLEHGCPITNKWRYHVEESELGQNGITKTEIHAWEQVGAAYLQAKREGVEFDFDHPEKAQEVLKRKEEEKQKKERINWLEHGGNGYPEVVMLWVDSNGTLVQYGYELGMVNPGRCSLDDIKTVRKSLQKMSELLDKREKEIHKELTTLGKDANEEEKTTPKKERASYTLSEVLKKASDVNITIKPDNQNN